ncbi:MAG TPA: AIR synthase related protein [Gaiellales bacterium]|jgi:thiamine-monophosphate kinase
MLPEEALVSAIARAVGGPSGSVVLGIGDDAAVLDDGTVVSTDILIDGVHFALDRTSPRDIGHRAATANLSDLAAMGARPVALVAAFGLPPGFEDAAEIAAGMHEHGVPVAGGDLSRSPVLVVSVTALGRADRPVRRSGGRPGDVLAVTGPLGGQAAEGYTGRVTPRSEEGCALAAVATAMIDVSDGIATDAGRLARASGVGAVVELERLPRAPGATVEQAATGGEDYELLAALPPGVEPPVPVTVVGLLTEARDVLLVDATGAPHELRGWDHFA